MRDVKNKTNTSIMMITHDLGVVAEMADYVVVMYAGKIIEEAPVDEIFEHPMHPYTEGLLKSKPVLNKDNGDRLYCVPGQVPNPIGMKENCYFSGRCEKCFEMCKKAQPILKNVTENHKVACWLYEEEFNMEQGVVLKVDGLKKYFPIKAGIFSKTVRNVKAVDDVSFEIKKGETFGLVGESGCGKSTTGRTILRLLEKTEGKVIFEGNDIYSLNKKQLRNIRTKMQMIFQDPYSSLNPRLSVGEIEGEALIDHKMCEKSELVEKVSTTIERCGLAKYHLKRYPHEFSGGQRQRIGIARALILNPSFIIADEPVSALDVSIQAQIINLLSDLQEERKFSYLFISHDLSVVKYISHKVGVMYLRSLVESASKDELYNNPAHPYIKALLSAVPIPDPKLKRKRILLKGDIPSPANPPSGCKFHTRCPYANKRCAEEIPEYKKYQIIIGLHAIEYKYNLRIKTTEIFNWIKVK